METTCTHRKPKHSNECKNCWKTRKERLYEVARKIVATGKCPQCGSKLKRNLSLSGWWQCEQYGAEGFRARSNEPSCDFQTFTE